MFSFLINGVFNGVFIVFNGFLDVFFFSFSKMFFVALEFFGGWCGFTVYFGLDLGIFCNLEPLLVVFP